MFCLGTLYWTYEMNKIIERMMLTTFIYYLSGLTGLFTSMLSIGYFKYSKTNLLLKIKQSENFKQVKMSKLNNAIVNFNKFKNHKLCCTYVSFITYLYDSIESIVVVSFNTMDTIHDVLYKSNYKFYVNMSDYLYIFYSFFILFLKTNNDNSNLNKVHNNNLIKINKINKKPNMDIKNKEQAIKILNDINNTLSSMSTLSSIVANLDKKHKK